MKVIDTGFKDLILIEPTIFSDERGYFYESFNEKTWKEKVGTVPTFVQDNESLSHQGVLRGLHFQKEPFSQGKLVRVVKGSVLDVAVDLRKDSPTYGEHYKVELSGANKKQLYVPEGFAHGFLNLEDSTIFSYKCTHFYNKESEDGLLWNDPELNINWGIKNPVLSEKDQYYKKFVNLTPPF